MTQIGEGVYTPPERPAEQDDGKIHLNIRMHVYNDGTGNNRTNIESRVEQKEVYLTLKQKKKSMDSYESDLTNVAIMEKYMAGTPTPGYHHTLSVYVEGPGTIDDEADRLLGNAVGQGEAGIRSKVERGLTKVVDKIMAEFTNSYKKNKEEIVIDLLTLDLFGFSRGAAVARNMLHEARFGRQPLKVRLAEEKITLHTVEVDFVGLYDTVASHGVGFTDATGRLRLESIVHARKVLHLVAADEHRENFTLTDIRCISGAANGVVNPGPDAPKTPPTGHEIFLPGAHSDIGGGYNNGEIEDMTIFNGFTDHARQDRAELIAAGWYEEHEITLVALPDMNDDDLSLPPRALLTVQRPRSMHAGKEEASRASLVQGGEPYPRDPRLPPPRSLPNTYQLIPLQIMARAARERGIEFDTDFDGDQKVLDPLWEAEEQINRYVAGTATKPSSPDHWLLEPPKPWLRRLRHDYLHFSARLDGIGMGPRFSNGRRKRKTYGG